MTPAVAGEKVLIGSCDGTVYAIDTTLGKATWFYDTQIDGIAAQFHGEALVRDGMVVIGADGPRSAHLYSFDAASGKLLWKRQFSYGVPTTILGFDDSIAFVSGDGTLISADLRHGTVRWQFEHEKKVEGRQRVSAIAKGNSVIFHCGEGHLHAFDHSSGRESMRVSLASPPSADPVVVGEDVVIATATGLIRVDGKTGEPAGEIDLGGQIYGSLRSDGEKILVLVERGRESALVALDPFLKKIEWEQTAGEWTSFRPLVRSGVVTVGGRNRLCSFRTKDGALAGCVAVPGVVRGIGHRGDHLFVGTLGGRVLSLPSSGK
jgi:eukaryotic-like serine/threonine-protein kinase